MMVKESVFWSNRKCKGGAIRGVPKFMYMRCKNVCVGHIALACLEMGFCDVQLFQQNPLFDGNILGGDRHQYAARLPESIEKLEEALARAQSKEPSANDDADGDAEMAAEAGEGEAGASSSSSSADDVVEGGDEMQVEGEHAAAGGDADLVKSDGEEDAEMADGEVKED